MQNLVALMVSDKDSNVFKDFNFFQVLLPWQPEFLTESNSFNSPKSDMDGRMTDNRPRHKLAGLWPVELKKTKTKKKQTDSRTDRQTVSNSFKV